MPTVLFVLLSLLLGGAGGPCPATAAEPVTIAVLGDSLAAGYGLSAGRDFPARLEAALRARGLEVTVANAGVSGDTTAGGRARLDWTLAGEPDIVIVELGANDALRGLSPEAAEANLDAILERLRQQGVQPILAGMRAPGNFGPAYRRRFDALYPRLAARHDVPFYPFFLAGVAGDPDLNQSDGIHPNARGVEVIVEGILPLVVETIEALRADPPNAGAEPLGTVPD